MVDKEFINSLKKLVENPEKAEQNYRELMLSKYNQSASNLNTSGDSGNIQEIGYEHSEDDEFTI